MEVLETSVIMPLYRSIKAFLEAQEQPRHTSGIPNARSVLTYPCNPIGGMGGYRNLAAGAEIPSP